MPRSTSTARFSLALLLALLGSLLPACLGPAGTEVDPAAEDASRALARARGAWRRGVAPDDPELLAALAEAREADPDWVAPRRFEDDLALAGYREVEALERRRDEVAAAPKDARAIYLRARLEGGIDGRDFARATGLAPTFAWGWHGLAWTLDRRGDAVAALRAERRAVELARDPWERAFFTLAQARILEGARRIDEVVELLQGALETIPLEGDDRYWFATEVALFELRLWDPREREVGYARGLELIRSDGIGERDLVRLVAAMRTEPALADPGGLELELALSGLPGELPARLLAEGWLRQGNSALGRLLLREELDGSEASSLAAALTGSEASSLAAALTRSEASTLAEALTRRSAFRQGLHIAAVRRWLDDLPAQVLEEDGLPADAALRRLVYAARDLEGPGRGSLDSLRSFGEALIDAGWFYEAQQVAESLAPLDLPAARSLRERAVAGRVLFAGVRAVLGDVEEGREELAVAVTFPSAGDEPLEDVGEETAATSADARPGDLDELLRRWAPLFARCASRQGRGDEAGGETVEIEAWTEVLLASPRLEYGFLATVLHPGPHFSEADERAGLGIRGEAVPGFAAEMARYGRFAIFGQIMGGGAPDGTILRRLLVEERSGEHLGVEWRGTVAWCEGADLYSRPSRRGARISGAALHEGYWLDVASVRLDHERWEALAERFEGPGGDARLARALAPRGLRLRTPAAYPERRRRERRGLGPALGEAKRVRLAAMRARAAPGERLGRVSLDELVEAVAVHEEGHLCDRARFLPIEQHLGEILALLVDCGFSATAVQRRLEYRAQLNALCELSDPRLSLAEVLDAVDRADPDSLGGLPHGEAYTELVIDLLALLDHEVERHPERWTSLDPDRTLLHQLHLLEPSEITELARELAVREGLL